MYIQHIKRINKKNVSISIILAENYRLNGKSKRKILANLTKWPEELIQDFSALLKGGKVTNLEQLPHHQGKSCGALIVLKELSKRMGLIRALGCGKSADLALLQIFARIIHQRSRLSIAREFIVHQAVEEVLGISASVSEDMLYENLDWLCEHQERIENQLFKNKYNDENKKAQLFLYDVTSTYFEGEQNELASYGYNRDKKKGKKQIVIGLLCDHEGEPISVEVFEGNTQDLQTFKSQLEKIKKRFGVDKVVIVGDKGMIKEAQIKQIDEQSWHYITSITKSQMSKLIKIGVFSMSLFDEEPCEIEYEGVRYILRRNPFRASEIQDNRNKKLEKIKTAIVEQNNYLQAHKRAKTETAIKRINKLIEKLKLHDWVQCKEDNQILKMHVDEIQKAELLLLDGCYVIKTNVEKKVADTKIIHDRYKDLGLVENAFRTIKTGLEEIRPIFVRKEKRTKGHVFVCMLAYKIVKRLTDALNSEADYTQKFIIDSLAEIQYIIYLFGNKEIKKLPIKLNEHQEIILNQLNIKLPFVL